MIQPVSTSLPFLSPAAGNTQGGGGFEQVLQELPSLGKIAGAAASGFLTGGPVGAGVAGGLALLQTLGQQGDQTAWNQSVVERTKAMLAAYRPIAPP